MNEYIDIYCERLDPGLWAEPLNAVSNISFFIAAYFAARLAQQKKSLDLRFTVLLVLLLAIGTGSALFHTLAVKWAMLSDTLPILFFQIAYIYFYGRRVMMMNRPRAGLLVGSYILLTAMMEQLPAEWLNGSISYGPALLFLAGLGVWHYARSPREKTALLLAGLVFLVSLTFRSLDMALCPLFPAGLHYAWHLLNGLVLYLTLRAYILGNPRKFS
ncbi:MAG: ceramidase domain-containing protein [Alphaproteobacteria bacterium]|nr:ceramidase domain-containing protein [Alphaproteobacteria bacterium]